MFIAEHIRNNLNRVNFNHLKDAGEALEATIGAPVRFLMPEGPRTVDGYTRRWTGNSSSMEHYPGFTEEDRDDKGVTVLFSSYNEAHEGTARWRYLWVPATAWEPAYEAAPFEWELYLPESMGPETIENMGGIPLNWHTEHGESTYGELHEGRVMFIAFAAGYPYNWGSWNWEQQFQPIVDNASPEARAAAAERMAARNREQFVQIIRDQGNIAITELRQKGAAVTQQIGEHQERLVNLLADKEQLGNQLAQLLASEGELTQEEIDREWELIEQNVNIERVMLGKTGGVLPRENRRQRENREQEEREGLRNPVTQQVGYMKLYTRMLYLQNPETQREMPLGKMEITLDFGTNTLRIKNLTHRMENRWDHPHVSEEGLCDADFRTTITELLRQRQVAPMANMVFNILRVVTLTDPWGHNNLPLWEEADNRWRRENGHPEWSPDEDIHPLKAAEAQAGEDTPADDDTEPGNDQENEQPDNGETGDGNTDAAEPTDEDGGDE